MIYFIKSESGHIKIGYSENGVESRLTSLQCGCPFKLTLLKTIDFEKDQEHLIHKKFKKFRRQGEWFELSEEITQYIENPYEIPKPIKTEKYFNSPELQDLIKKCGSKKEAAERLMVSVRYIDMLLAGKKPSKRLEKMIKIYLWT